MDFVIEFIFELFGEIIGAIIESDRVPKAVRYSIVGAIAVTLLAVLCVAIGSAGSIVLTVVLSLLALGLLAAIGYVIYHIHRSGILKPAKKEELPQILKLYRSVIGKPGCTWTVFYPNEATLHEDFKSGNLFVLHKGKNMIGAASIVPENELDDLTCWQFKENAREIARIVIAPEFQGKGYGKHLVKKLCLKLESMDCKAVHILVAKENHHALNLYRNTGFQNKGECSRYGHEYYAYEKKLS